MESKELSRNIYTIDAFWTKQQCEDFIEKCEQKGFEDAKILTGGGYKVVPSVRNNERVMYKDYDLADEIWQLLKPFAPQYIGQSEAIGLNEMFRIYKYQPGQQFKRHRDLSYVRDESEASYFTFMIYLNDNFEGGDTGFSDSLRIQPKQGTALIFLHDLLHEGSSVLKGTKYVLRTDIMYKIPDAL
jgi:hypothetical protein